MYARPYMAALRRLQTSLLTMSPSPTRTPPPTPSTTSRCPIPSGKIIAIVGPNGAGKSTLLKLLCRFYDPNAGSIEIDGQNIKQIPIDDLRRSITVLFQQPFHYNTTVRDNILYGDLQIEASDAELDAAIQAAGASEIVSRLPDREQTLLGRWFPGGTELSVGEWQRIALARAFLRRAPIIILDEPTSALDPWAEADWLERFRRLAFGRTSIIITHRFTTAMHADVIHVMDRGRIVESGSHQRLLEQNGLYAESWSAAEHVGRGLHGRIQMIYTDENELLLSIARREVPHVLVRQQLDWDYVVATARAHGLLPLLQKHIADHRCSRTRALVPQAGSSCEFAEHAPPRRQAVAHLRTFPGARHSGRNL